MPLEKLHYSVVSIHVPILLFYQSKGIGILTRFDTKQILRTLNYMVECEVIKNNPAKKAKMQKLGLWIQVMGQIIEIKGLSGLLHIEEDANSTGEQQILTGVLIKTIGQKLEAISVSSQIGEIDIIKLLREQKLAI